MKTDKPSNKESDLEINNEAVIKPGTDTPQEMGDENVKITEEIMDQTSKRGCHCCSKMMANYGKPLTCSQMLSR